MRLHHNRPSILICRSALSPPQLIPNPPPPSPLLPTSSATMSATAADPLPGSASAAPAGPATPATTSATDARLRIALRYSLSPSEYQLLHKHLIVHAPAVRRRALPPASYERLVHAAGDDDYNASTFRIGLRLFASAYAALRLWEFVARRLYAPKGKPLPYVPRNPSSCARRGRG